MNILPYDFNKTVGTGQEVFLWLTCIVLCRLSQDLATERNEEMAINGSHTPQN